MLCDCADVLDGHDNLKLVLDVDVVKLVCLDRDRGMQGFLKDRYRPS